MQERITVTTTKRLPCSNNFCKCYFFQGNTNGTHPCAVGYGAGFEPCVSAINAVIQNIQELNPDAKVAVTHNIATVKASQASKNTTATFENGRIVTTHT